MAQGVLPLLLGNDCQWMDSFLYNEKTYTAEAVLGVETDTYDPLGFIVRHRAITSDDIDKYITAIMALDGQTFKQKYPAYSSFVVNGNPLWWWAKTGRLSEIVRPSKDVTVKSVKVGEVCQMPLDKYISMITDEIDRVTDPGFRQDAIKEGWARLMPCDGTVVRITLTFTVSGGTYIRSLINDACAEIPAHAHLITRTAYGAL